ncbi:MAG: NFACT family protein [Deltaproteobacteria bacterium]|nr:NFACT family protein [Deltaproteobacteria bacterium]
MSLNASEIEQVVGELQPLVGGFVQKLSLTEPRSLWIELRKPGESFLLLACAEQGRTRLHLGTERPAAPEPPFAFQGLVRAELMGCALEALETSPGERVVTLRFSGKEAGGRHALVAELTGRHGNLFLIDERGLVLGSAVPNLSEKRDNRPGRPYVPLLARSAPAPEDEASRFASSTSTGTPFAVSAAIAAAYAGREHHEMAEERRRVLTTSFKSKLQRLVRTIGKVEGDVERAGRAEEHRRRGEMLKTSLGKLRRGMKEVTLTEYSETGVQEVTIALDPTRTPQQSLEREFHQYRRLLAGQTRARTRLEALRTERTTLEERLAAVAALSEEELLRQAPGPQRPALPGRRRRAGPALPYREFLSGSGQRIRVGRGARENDGLTFRHSRGNDVWMHARGVPGAHVVVPLEREEALADETLRDAALLAAHHCESRGDAVEVTWTRVKYVHRQKGAPGAVVYSQDKTVLVRPDAARLERLKATAEHGEG